MANQFDVLINSFVDNNIGIDRNFLSPSLSLGLQQNIKQLQKDGMMTSAGIGNNQLKDAQQQMRSDKIYWLNKEHDDPFENQFLQQADELVEYLNRTCYAGINDYEFHYAVYEEGTFYRRHKDQFKNDSKRKYSLICYLNNNWTEEDGGQLVVYGDGAALHILPHAETAVFFKSNESEHEVTRANRSRMSVTGWLKQV